jgi:hypothetical protein
MKKLMCFIALMLVAGAVVADKYLTVRVANESAVVLKLDAISFTILSDPYTEYR